MKKINIYIIAAVSFFLNARSSQATSTTDWAAIEAENAAEIALTSKEYKTVVSLAKACGISNVAKVDTYHMLPGPGRGITVNGDFNTNGRSVTFETLGIHKRGWDKSDYKYIALYDYRIPSNAICKGDFWVDSSDKPEKESRTLFRIDNKTIQIQLDPKIPLPTADKIVAALTSKRIRFAKTFNFDKTRFETEGFSTLSAISCSDHHAHYDIYFSGLSYFELKLSGNYVIILSFNDVLT